MGRQLITNMLFISVVSFLGVCSLASVAGAQSQQIEKCADHARAAKLEKLLESADTATSAEDITASLRELGRLECTSSIPVLLKYLGFRRPPTEGERNGIFLRAQTITELYPAANALWRIGGASIPALTRIIGEETTSDVAAYNAAYLVVSISRPKQFQGIQLLRDIAEHSTNTVVRHRVEELARKMVKWCGEEQREKCNQEANRP